MEFLIGLIVFFFAILTIVLIGHGIWVFVAFVWSVIFGSHGEPQSQELPKRPLRRWCPGCDCKLLPEDLDCPRCGLDQGGRKARDLERLRNAEREVSGLAQRGELDAETASLVAGRLAARVRVVLKGPLPRAKPVADEVKPPAVVQPAPADAVEIVEPPESPPPPEVAVVPPEPPRPHSGVLTAFMEDKNILWGELIGGLLIVGCSIALVLTLWRSLEALPYFPFLLSTAITAILFGAGQYTLHHWKLASTSRGLLVIALLLAPLNLLLLATPGGGAAGEWLDAAVKLFAVALFVGIVRTAGRDLIGTALLPGPVDRRWLLALAVVGAPAVLFIPVGDWTFLPGWLPLACQAGACGAVLGGLTRHLRRDGAAPLKEAPTSALLMFVGISAFALFAAWGLLLTRSVDIHATLNQLSLPLAIAGIPVLEAGLLVQRRLAAGHPGVRATGTGVALAGSGLLASAVALAWPDPLGLTLVAAVVGVLLTRIAWRDSLPWFQVGATPALGLACVLGVHGFTGQWTVPPDAAAGPWLGHLLGASTSGIVLAGFALALAAVAEIAVRCGHRPQGVGYVLGGLASGAVGLLVINGHGPEQPWVAVGGHFACAVGLLASNVRWRRRVAAQAGVWLVLVASLWLLWTLKPTTPGAWDFGIALESLALAALALGLTTPRVRLRSVVFDQLRGACRTVSVAAGVLALVFAVTTPGFPAGALHTAAFLGVTATALVLARAFKLAALTWVGSALGFATLLHLTASTADVRPTTAAVLLALLGHATLAALLSHLARLRRPYVRLIAEPLRQTVRVSAGFAVPLLVVPAPGHALAWSGFALWLAVAWFAVVWRWKERGAFSLAQAALSLAAVLAGLAWVEGQEWWQTTALGAVDPRALQAFGVGLGALALGWIAARRLLRGNERFRELWLDNPLSVDRLVTAAVIGGHFLLLAVAVLPPANAELTPLGQPGAITAPAELASAFDSGGWLLIGLLGVALTASLRLRTQDQPPSDATLIGLVVLGLGAPLLVAGSFAPDIAAASALRWGLALAFLAGSCVLFAREPLSRVASKAGVSLDATPMAAKWAYALFAMAAGVAVLLTADIAHLGLNGLTPSGPRETSVFARMGWTASSVVPMALVVLGLAGTAVRERLAGYAFAAGLVFTATATGGYALGVVTSGGTIDSVVAIRLGMIAAGSAALWAVVWLAAERRVPGGPLLALQSGLGLVGVGLLVVVPLVRVYVAPAEPLPSTFAELGQFGWLVLALAGWAAFHRAWVNEPSTRGHIAGACGIVAGVLAACAVQPLDEPGQWLSFLALAAAWAVVGLALTALLFRAPGLARGAWLNVVAAGLVLLAIRYSTAHPESWLTPPALAGYALVVAVLAVLLATRSEEDDSRWNSLIAAETILAGAAAVAGVFASVSGPLLERFAGPLAYLLLAASAGLLASKAPLAVSRPLRFVSVLAAAVGCVLVGWALPEPDAPAVWLQRNGWAFVALVAVVVACLEVVPRLLSHSAWSRSARRVGGGFAVAAVVALCVVLCQQATAFNPVTRRTPLELLPVLMILTGIGALIALSTRFALRPGADPFRLPEPRRTSYVYIAELLLVLFFVHIRFNLPELFLGYAVRYWTFIVMLLAFAGVGFAEVFERRGSRVLAVPLRRTGLLLPFIPLLAFWAKPPGLAREFADGNAPGLRPLLGYLETLPQNFDSYAGLWLLAGLLYGLIALRRRSFGWALIAALAANAGMWAMLAHNGVSAAVHPQVWVIPLSLIVLVSEHVNRRELRREVSTGLRYLGVGMLYVSSAADLFIAGVGESVWLPVVLAVFCVAGIFAGIILRVRAFLFLGAGFLLLDIFAMIWHSAVDRDQTWVWYVSGIVLGAAILALFALFEKRKNDVHDVVERLRRWD